MAFQKVWLQPAEKKQVQLTIDPVATSHPLDIWDTRAQQWMTVDGNFQVNLGTSSADIGLSQSITVRNRSGNGPPAPVETLKR